jgi:putative two-component system response regulator
MSSTRRRRELWMGAPALPVRILVIDDDPQVRDALGRLLETGGYETVCVGDAISARERMQQEWFHLVLCDVRLPGESGMQLAQELALEAPHVAVLMVSGVNDLRIAEAAFEIGAYDYLLKPFSGNEVLISVANAVRRRALRLEEEATTRRLTAVLREQRVALEDARASLAEQQEALRQSRHAALYRLARVAEIRTEDMGGHMERVGLYTELLAAELGLGDEQCEALRMASPLHDIGKLGLPDQILLKPGPLTAEERVIMQGHTEVGYALLIDRHDPLLDLAARIALTHHEHINGDGYPRRLKGEAIPIEGRIVAVADAFDAMTSDRPYRAAIAVDEALSVISSEASIQFDPGVVVVAQQLAESMGAIAAQRIAPPIVADTPPDDVARAA